MAVVCYVWCDVGVSEPMENIMSNRPLCRYYACSGWTHRTQSQVACDSVEQNRIYAQKTRGLICMQVDLCDVVIINHNIIAGICTCDANIRYQRTRNLAPNSWMCIHSFHVHTMSWLILPFYESLWPFAHFDVFAFN